MRLDLGRTGDERLHLAGDDLGQGDSVVLVHGWPGSARVWDDLRAELLAAGHRVISHDRRGFGRSGPPSSGYEVDALAEDLARVLTQLALQDVTLVGWDLGCTEIMRLLGTTGDDRIARVAFIAPPHRSPDWVEATRRALDTDRFQALQAVVDEAFQYPDSSDRQAARQAWWIDACATAPHALRATLDAYLADRSDDCARIRVPTLVISSAAEPALHDPLPSLALARREAIAAGSRALLPTHGPQVAAALRRFMAELA